MVTARMGRNLVLATLAVLMLVGPQAHAGTWSTLARGTFQASAMLTTVPYQPEHAVWQDGGCGGQEDGVFASFVRVPGGLDGHDVRIKLESTETKTYVLKPRLFYSHLLDCSGGTISADFASLGEWMYTTIVGTQNTIVLFTNDQPPRIEAGYNWVIQKN